MIDNRPVYGRIYTARQVIQWLSLKDNPCLSFCESNGVLRVVQNSHLTELELLSVPGFADSKWKYHYTTNEWIPVFHFVGTWDEFTEMFNFELSTDWFEDPAPNMYPNYWITPRGFPREQ